MNHIVRSYTLIGRTPGQIIEGALAGTNVRHIGEMTLSGTQVEIVNMLPRAHNVLCIEHRSGHVYGMKPTTSTAHYLGDLYQYLDYSAVNAAYVNTDLGYIHFQTGMLLEATDCLRDVAKGSIGECMHALSRGKPFYVTKSQICRVLINALKKVAERKILRENGHIGDPAFGVNDIFAAITPLTKEQAGHTARHDQLGEHVGA